MVVAKPRDDSFSTRHEGPVTKSGHIAEQEVDTRRRGFLRKLMATAVLAVSVSAAAQAQPIRIGVVGPLTGPLASTGIAIRQGAELAIEDVNVAGGIDVDGKKRKVVALFEDSQAKPDVGVSAALKLLTVDNVDALMGDSVNSSTTLALMDLVPNFDKIFVSGEPVSTAISDKVRSDPEKYANFWKLDYDSEVYAQAVAGTLLQLSQQHALDAPKKTIAYIVEDTDYGRVTAQSIQVLVAKDGWSSASLDAVPPASTDFYAVLTRLRASPPDVLVSVFTSTNAGIALAKQVKEQALKSQEIFVYSPIRAEFIKGVGPAAEGLLWTPLSFDSVNDQPDQVFAKRIADKFKTTASGDSAWGYCFMSVLLDGIKKAGSIKAATVSVAFKKLDYSCLTGRWVFDPKSHAPLLGPDYLSAPMAQIQKGTNAAIWPPHAATAKYVTP